VTPHGILCNDAAGSIIALGDKLESLKVGDKVAPITDTANLTGREPGRSWLAADEDGVLAEYLIFDEKRVSKLPEHLDWVQSSIIPCAGVTAWSALKGVGIGKSVLIQGMPFFFSRCVYEIHCGKKVSTETTQARAVFPCSRSNSREQQD
jgi:NADPH:quinone reductase-like Zn-dependent oxidoreductase